MKKLFILILIVIIAGGAYIFFSPSFERISPEVVIDNNGYWNVKTPLKINISDNSGIKYYRIYFGKYKVEKEFNNNFPKKITVEFKLPRRAIVAQKDILKVEAVDISKWQFWAGNLTKIKKEIVVDKRYPAITVISHSYGIGRGGAALVIFKAVDKNLKNINILVNKKHIFKIFPYIAKNYYISLICWPVKEQSFQSEIVASDFAGNKSTLPISFYKKNYRYKTTKIVLNEKFLKTKVEEILEKSNYEITDDFITNFKKMNEKLRNENETLIENVANDFQTRKITNFKINIFKPLENAARMASFGDHRFYFYNGKKVSESWHLGVDLASIKNAPIVLSNKGKIVYTNFTGIYGNVLMAYHGLGLFSLYAHCSTILVNDGENVKSGSLVAKTGATGAVFGDHLHFGILIQGIEVLPLEWLDRHWLKDNIYKVINDAKGIVKVLK